MMAPLSIFAREWLAWQSSPALRRLPRVDRRYRAASPPRQAVLTVCNKPYLAEHASYLTRSIDRHAPGNALHLHLVNPDPEMAAEVERLQATCTRTRITRTHEHFPFVDREGEFERAYCAAIRLIRGYQFLFHAGRPLLVLDADSIVRTPLEPLWEEVETAGLAARTRFDDRRAHLKFALGTLYLGCRPETLALMRETSIRLADRIRSRALRWFDDQICLYEAYETRMAESGGPRLMHLPSAFADWDFDDASTIWAGKGPRKVEDGPYLQLRKEFEAG